MICLDKTRHPHLTPVYTVKDYESQDPHPFSYPGYLVVLKFLTERFIVSVTSDAASSANHAKIVALRRARSNDRKSLLGRLIQSQVYPDTPENRKRAGIDTARYDYELEWSLGNRWVKRGA